MSTAPSSGDAARQIEDVRRYYDRNTGTFARVGQGKTAIHRAVWGPSVRDREAAMHYVDELILAELASFGAAPRVLDLGCGLGASLIYLAERRALVGVGVTLSPLQAARANEEIRATGLAELSCREGNFLELPAELVNFDLAYSIEAFIHSPSAEGYFAQASRTLRPGGKLCVCDDFLNDTPVPGVHARTLDAFRWGWRVGSLLAPTALARVAEQQGFSLLRRVDLSSYLELNRPRDLGIRLAVRLLGRLPPGEYWHSLVGGDALQRLLTTGVLRHELLVFERRS